jgi:alginate O-acetyltransferase complex protein AlgI
MLFSSPDFLFGFLPLFLLLYAIVGQKLRNLVLFLASLTFYFSTSGELTVILALSVVLNWALALQLARSERRTQAAWLVLGVVLNLLPLLYYKYARFFLGAIGDALAAAGWSVALPRVDPPLPIGISFFTFQALSYIADVALGRVLPARSLINFGMYHSCFPQLIAGPIVRYEEIASEVARRKHRLVDLHNGVVQFCFGLGKKVILADQTGAIADAVFGLPVNHAGFSGAWLGLVAYTLQIYFDFSGYSDMAIGLGRCLGFHYPENFNQPYLSCSVTEFWRRWHMTLSRWFRDYVYIPLGGNRRGLVRTLMNLLTVFFLCGLWHGAEYSFVVWGLLHGALLMLERLGRACTDWRPPALLGWAYTLGVVMIAWVFFRSAGTSQAIAYIGDLFDPRTIVLPVELYATLTPNRICYLVLAALAALVPFRPFVRFTDGRYYFGPALSIASLAVALLAITMMAANGFSPFIYFRF